MVGEVVGDADEVVGDDACLRLEGGPGDCVSWEGLVVCMGSRGSCVPWWERIALV